MTRLAPVDTVRAANGMVASVDTLATQAGIAALRSGGSAVDAALAANAVLTVTLPNQCGLGGDLFALVSPGGRGVESLVAAGRAGRNADAETLRSAGVTSIPAGDPQSVTIPGCVDGWVALHERHGRLPLAELLAPAIEYAIGGFPVSEFAAEALVKRAASSSDAAAVTGGARLRAGQLVRRPGAGRVLEALAAGGRDAVFDGEFGEGIVSATGGRIDERDLADSQAVWAEPVSIEVWGHRVWTPSTPSQGYLTLAAASIAETVGLAADPDDPAWAHLLIESMRQAAYDRPAVLFDGADPTALLDERRLSQRAEAIDPEHAAALGDSYRKGGTTYLCATDSDGTAVSLIQSNCMSFGSGLVAGGTGIWLQNRGIGFSIEAGHPGELAPGRRPAHTLAPALVTDLNGGFVASVGTRGGDSQPQIVLQLLARLLAAGERPADALAAGRWILRGADDETSFNTWGSAGKVRVDVEGQAPAAWLDGLKARGHLVERSAPFAHPFGHAQIITAAGGSYFGAADSRASSGSAAGF